jgi:transposase
VETQSIKKKYKLLAPFLDEKTRRLYLAVEAKSIGYGGISEVSKATGVSRTTITQGCKELDDSNISQQQTGIRKKGGGRKNTVEKNPMIGKELEMLVEPYTRGDPESPLRWTCKSTRKLAEMLSEKGFKISHVKVADLLVDLGYSLQGNKKTIEGENHPDRNAQFEYINEKTKEFQKGNQPVISVDTKKKELIGNFKNNGKEYRPKGNPREVFVHDFKVEELGKANPYGVYDIVKNSGWVNVGIDNDTAQFAVESIRRWWYSMGKNVYPNASKILINADCGGSNGYRVRLWKTELQKLATETGIEITVAHLPPGTSKWNKIEHRLFSFISQNWRGQPLVNLETIVSLIAATKTEKGLTVKCSIDENKYPKGLKISDKEMDLLNISKNDFHGEWNYTLAP